MQILKCGFSTRLARYQRSVWRLRPQSRLQRLFVVVAVRGDDNVGVRCHSDMREIDVVHCMSRIWKSFWSNIQPHHSDRIPQGTAQPAKRFCGSQMSDYNQLWLRQLRFDINFQSTSADASEGEFDDALLRSAPEVFRRTESASRAALRIPTQFVRYWACGTG